MTRHRYIPTGDGAEFAIAFFSEGEEFCNCSGVGRFVSFVTHFRAGFAE